MVARYVYRSSSACRNALKSTHETANTTARQNRVRKTLPAQSPKPWSDLPRQRCTCDTALADVEPLHARIQRGRFEAEKVCGATLAANPAPGLLQDPADVPPFDASHLVVHFL